MVARNGCTLSFSKILNEPCAEMTPVSRVLFSPIKPIEVLWIVSSLSCCNVSRSACSPCLISSSSVPVRARQSVTHTTPNKQLVHDVQSWNFS